MESNSFEDKTLQRLLSEMKRRDNSADKDHALDNVKAEVKQIEQRLTLLRAKSIVRFQKFFHFSVKNFRPSFDF